jgi:hypothetical protein
MMEERLTVNYQAVVPIHPLVVVPYTHFVQVIQTGSLFWI